MTKLPKGLRPGDAVYGDDVHIGHVASDKEISTHTMRSPSNTMMNPITKSAIKQVVMQLPEGDEINIPVLFEHGPTSMVAQAVEQRDGPGGTITLRIVGRRRSYGASMTPHARHGDGTLFIKGSAAVAQREARDHLGDYSRALDEQVDLLRYIYTDAGERWVDALGLGRTSGTFWRQAMGVTLRQGETFYVTPAISEFLGQSTAHMPDLTLFEELLPAKVGFVLFDKPLPMPPLVLHDDSADSALPQSFEMAMTRQAEPGDRLINDDMAAVGWVAGRDEHDAVPADARECIVLTFYNRPQGPRTPLRPAIAFAWHFGLTQDDVAKKTAVVEAERQAQDVEGEHEYWMRVRRLRMNYVIGLFTFLKQRILMPTHPQPATRATRKRVETTDFRNEPTIRVVEYRRREYRAPEPRDTDESGREYHVRWIVGASTGGYWSHYHTKNGIEGRWILPYEKGNPAHPLKKTPTSINVVRR